VGVKFLENRNNPDYFEPVPQAPSEGPKEDGVYTVTHNGQDYVVEVKAGGDISSVQVAGQASNAPQAAGAPQATPVGDAEDVGAPLAGNIWKILVSPNQQVNEGDTLVILEAMKMETEIKAARSGTVVAVKVKDGDQVSVGQALISLA
jgi:oxaloacetate decarboxylase alpha subunit